MMYKKVLSVVVLSGVARLALAGEGTMPADNNAGQPAGNQPGSLQAAMLKNLTAQQFVNDAAIGGMKEIRLSKMVLGASKDAEVRTFATRMVTDHSMANRKLEQIARQEGLNCPATNTFAADDPNWRNPIVESSTTIKGQGAYLLMTNGPDVADYQALQRLKGLSGHEMDLAYARDMVSDHITTINEFEAASRNLSDPALRKFAADTLPTLREHSQMAQKLESQIVGQTAQSDDSKKLDAPVTADAGGR